MALWDQMILQDGSLEPDDHYGLFLQFCQLGYSRSFSAVARIVGISSNVITRIAHRWDWQKRATSWDLEQTRMSMQLSQRQYIQDLQFYSDQRRVGFDAAFGLAINMLTKVNQRIDAMKPPPRNITPEQQQAYDEEIESQGETIPLHLVPAFAKTGVMLLEVALNNKGHVLALDEISASLRNLGTEMGNVRSSD